MSLTLIKFNLLFLLLLAFNAIDSAGHGTEFVAIQIGFVSLLLMSVFCLQSQYILCIFLFMMYGLAPLANGYPSDIGTVAYDFLQCSAFVSIALYFYNQKKDVNTPVLLTFGGMFVVLTAVVCLINSVTVTETLIRGEVPPILILTVSVAFLMGVQEAKRVGIYYLSGLVLIISYTSIGIINGYRTSVVLVALVIPLLVIYHIRNNGNRSRGSKKYRYLIISVGVIAVASLGYLLNNPEYNQVVRALQIRTAVDSNSAVSSNVRLDEITDAFHQYVSRDAFGILFGSGFGTAVFENSIHARVIHNLWVTIITRHGFVGILFAMIVHYYVLMSLILFVKTDVRNVKRDFVYNLIRVGGILALVDSHIRFSWSEPAGLFLLAAATGVSLNDRFGKERRTLLHKRR